MFIERFAAASFARRLSTLCAIIFATGMLAGSPAHAQFFWVSPDNSGAPVIGGEPDIGIPLPGATAEEQQAMLVWTVRTGLNTAALQCQFEPLLVTVENYNGTIDKHEAEFVASYRMIENYFKRTGGRQWQSAFDTYRTRIYNYFATVNAQYTFCQAAGKIGTEALFTPKGSLNFLARNRMREFRNSLIYRGDQLRTIYPPQWTPIVLPSLEDKCWRRDKLKSKCQRAYEDALKQSRGLVYR